MSQTESGRKPFDNPSVGDVFRLSTGVYLLVDYADALQLGTRTSAGESRGFNYRGGFNEYLRRNGAVLVERAEESLWAFAGEFSGGEKGVANAEEARRHLEAVVHKYNPPRKSDQSAPRFYRPDGTFDPAAFSRAFWRMASPAYNGAEFPLHDDPKTAGMTEADVTRLVAANIASHAMWVGGGSTEPPLVEELLSMDFVEGAARLLVELGSQQEALLREGA